MFGLVSVLLLNAVAILSEDRFIARIGWGSQQEFGIQDDSIRTKMLGLTRATRTVMRPFLMIFNILIIGYEILFG
ncbi:uncharacterized protein SAPINGB_P005276 [Magnusiomyces paraingens]|uniref:Yos1-like protein n=1 Tax=Magnusiomyces paraingens TaxID=2606893 RepID=A0A5E8BYT1_9ASCO|nr:uncharacterized protein SAPINGB_P005276 [Saprochaete ingens]VVT56789.1 unnamed protein product [Saprochaete ingens]